MGKLKFEKTFSEKLKGREIEPGAGSWEQLSKKLDASEGDNKKWTYWWMGIAATIIGGILIFGSFFNSPVTSNPGIVNNPSEKTLEKEIDQAQDPSEIEINMEEIVFEENEKVINKPTAKKALKTFKELNQTLQNNKSTVAAIENDLKVQEPKLEEPEFIEAENPEVSQSIGDAIADVLEKETTGNITEAEVDALLARAAAEISLNKKEKFSSGNIDAQSLLQEVEFEMEESFREKVFEVLKEGYLKARTAVANRNN